MSLLVSQIKALLTKNMRLLLRSKSSSLAILLGPLLVILIVGIVFSSSGMQQATLGVYVEEFENADLYVSSLDEQFILVEYSDEQSCVEAVRRSTTNGCVALLADRQAHVHVDPTDTALVYEVIDRVSGQLDAQSGELRAGLAQQLLASISSTSEILASDQQVLADLSAELSRQQQVSELLSESFDALRVDSLSVSPADVQAAVDDVVEARDAFEQIAVEMQQDYLSDAPDNASRERAREYRDRINNVSVSDANELFASLIASLGDVSEQISDSHQQSAQLQSQAREVSDSLSEAIINLNEVVSRTSSQADSLDAINISDRDITDPISTSIMPVTREGDELLTVFPAFLALLVMFTTMLLASQLVINERASQAYFRNFITPTPDWLFVVATYITTAVVVLVQLLLLFLAVSLFSSVSVLANFSTNLVLLFAIVTFFSFLGMLIGYFFTTQEGVMLSSISVSSLFLLVSGLVLAVDTLPGIVRFFVNANPFVISTDLLTGSLVFGFGLTSLLTWFVVLILYSLMLFAAIMIFQRVARVQYFESAKTAAHVSTFLGESEVPAGKELHVGDHVINSKESLLQVLVSLSDEEYEEYADHERNLFADWVHDVYKDDRLARLLRNTSRSGAITVLKNEL